MTTPAYRIDQAADGTVRVWSNFASEYILALTPVFGVVVATTYSSLARKDERRADDFMYGYSLAVAHCSRTTPVEMAGGVLH